MKPINFKLLNALLICALLGTIAGMLSSSLITGLAMGFALVAAGLFEREKSAAFMATPDTSALAAYAGDYQMELFSTLRAKLTILDDLVTIPDIKNNLKLTKLTVKDGVRGYREEFDAGDDDLSYSGRDLSVELLKRDLKINPLKYRSTWMSKVMKKGVNPEDVPFAEFVNNAIVEQVASEIQRGAYFAVKGDGSTLLKTFDGLGTLIAKGILAENTTAGTGLTPIATGALTNTNGVAKFEEMVANTPSEFVQNGLEVKASVDSVRKYQEDYRERYGKYKAKNEKGLLEMEDVAGKVIIKPCHWMGTSGRLISSPYENLLNGIDGIGDQDNIHTDVELEIIKYRILFAFGQQIRDLNAMRVNDQI